MKTRSTIFILLISLSAFASESLESLIGQAVEFEQKKDFALAAETMKEAIDQYQNIPVAHAYYGYYKGMQAGSTENYIQAGMWVNTAFKHLDKAVELDPNCVEAHFFRGMIGVNVPQFFGKLEQAITDLEWIIHLDEQILNKIPKDQLMAAYQMLVHGYKQNNQPEEASAIQKRIEALSPSQSHKTAPQSDEEPSGLKKFEGKEYSQQILKNADSLRESGEYTEATSMLKKFIQNNPKDLDAVMLLIRTFAEWADAGYAASIKENTNERAQLALDVMYWMDKAVTLDSNNIELRIERNALGIDLLFFVEKLDASIEDLETMLTLNLSDDQTAQVQYMLGRGYQKKYLKIWNKAVTKYPYSQVAQEIKNTMHPPVKKIDLDKVDGPVVVIDFVLGYQDQLAPQTALWIENKQGDYIKTIYVSGFSGHVKDKQVVLPKWAESTQFRNVDGVTAASIGWGEHIYTWDLKDINGQKVKKGQYRICLEITHWPSNIHQKSDMMINIKKSGSRIIGETSDCITYWDATYIK